MIFGQLFKRSALKDAAHGLYGAAVRQAREPAFYSACAVPDTLDGRFDLIVLHVFMLMRGLKRLGEPGERLGKALLEVMFDDMDQNLREMGVGDLSVGKKVKAMARAFYGRSKAYGDALAPDAEATLLAAALGRNIYGRTVPTPGQLGALEVYVRDAVTLVQTRASEAFLAGRIEFPPAPGAAPAGA
jgi:cytochrome b pre-mRNA-processing protein 3